MTSTETKQMTVATAMEMMRRPAVTVEIGITGSSLFITTWPKGTDRGCASNSTVQLDRHAAIELRDRLTKLLDLD